VGRKNSEIVAAFQKVPKMLSLSLISIEGHLEDLQCFISQELSMSGTSTDKFKENIAQRIVRDSQNNFLVSIVKSHSCCRKILIRQWVRLAVDKLNLCHTQADIKLALQQLPVGMEALYDRMASSIA